MSNTISDEKFQELKKSAVEILANDRHALLIKFPFAGNILMRMDLIPVRDKRCRTACTDGNNVFFDISFMNKLTDKERVFVLAHEVWHCVLLHLVRCQSRIPELFNIATDMEVNYMLSQQDNGKLFEAPKNLCFPPNSMKGKSAEVIYEWLLRKANNKDKGQDGNSLSMSGDNSGNCGDGHNGKASGNLEGQFDKHKYDDQNEMSDENSDNVGDKNTVSDEWGEVGYDKDFKPRISKDFSEKMREAVIAEAQRCQRTQGTMPNGLDGILKQITKPELNWKEELSKFISQCYGGNPKWTPPNRRHIYNEIYLQSHKSEKINVAVCIDTSGSCVGDLPKFFGELKGLLDSFGKYELHLLNCDASVDYYEKFCDDDNPLNISVGENIKWTGGGGTSFKPPFKYIREHNIQPNCFVYFTDGFGDAPTYPPPYPVLWVLTKDHDGSFCDWGKKIIFKKSSSEDYTILSS